MIYSSSHLPGIPRTPGVPPTGTPPAPPVTGGPKTMAAEPAIRLIIVDDEAPLLRAYKRILGQHLGYQPEEIGTATDRMGALAIYAAHQSTVLAVVTDGEMRETAPHNPQESGLILHDELRELGFKGPIAVISAHLDPAHPRATSRMFRCLQTLFYKKPVTPADLISWLKHHGVGHT